jgi:hypothetical protein
MSTEESLEDAVAELTWLCHEALASDEVTWEDLSEIEDAVETLLSIVKSAIRTPDPEDCP